MPMPEVKLVALDYTATTLGSSATYTGAAKVRCGLYGRRGA